MTERESLSHKQLTVTKKTFVFLLSFSISPALPQIGQDLRQLANNYVIRG